MDAALHDIIFLTAPKGSGWYFTLTSIKIQINGTTTGRKGWSLMCGGGAPYERWLIVVVVVKFHRVINNDPSSLLL